MRAEDSPMNRDVLPENFVATRSIYDKVLAANIDVHDLVYPRVFGDGQYIGQFSDNSAEELKRMGASMQLPAGSEVLDIGCGRGHVARFLGRLFEWEMTGIDLSEVPLRDALSRQDCASPAAPTFVLGNLYEHSFGRQFDGAYGTGAFCHFDAARLFSRASSLLRAGGRIGFMERTRQGMIGEDNWLKLTRSWSCPYVYSVEEYLELLRNNDFTVLHALDMTSGFRVWQERSVAVRRDLRQEIIRLSSEDYYEASVAFASYENDVTRDGMLGYVCVVAQRNG